MEAGSVDWYGNGSDVDESYYACSFKRESAAC